jgi:hypothetical protein
MAMSPIAAKTKTLAEMTERLILMADSSCSTIHREV